MLTAYVAYRVIPGDQGHAGRASTTGASLPVLSVTWIRSAGASSACNGKRPAPTGTALGDEREAQIRKTVQEFLDWAVRNGVQSRTMQGCWLSFFTGWELGETSRSDWADPAFGTPDFDTEQGRTWYLRVSR